jgi:glycosyltransferase involved in cell wall biosynthesis
MLAIIIPYYKLVFFEATLQSLANQSDKRFKVYIGDDASPEDCSKVIAKFKGHFELLYKRFETNLGSMSLVKQWQRCIDLIEDEQWIMILGDDDQLEHTVVEDFYKKYDAFVNKSNVIRFATQIINHKKSQVSGVLIHDEWEKATTAYYKKIKGLTRSSLSEYIFSRPAYEKHQFRDYPLAWHSDDMAWIDFSENKPIFSINESCVKIGISDVSLSGIETNTDIKYIASLQFYKDIICRKLHLFLKSQRLDLLLEYESLVKQKRQPNREEWRLFFSLYCKNFTFISFLKLIRRILISMFK